MSDPTWKEWRLKGHDWKAFRDELAEGKQPEKLTWALNDVFPLKGHIGWDVTAALDVVHNAFPTWSYELRHDSGGWWFRLSDREDQSFNAPAFAIYQAICILIERKLR